jgi:hypothetical protein
MTPPCHNDPEDPPEDDAWEHPGVSSFEGTHSCDAPTWVRRTRGWFFQTWQPKALPIPRADGEMIWSGAVERAAEVFRYMFHCLEYWISPGGWLREWIRLNLRLAFLVAIPALLVGPLVTKALVQLNAWVTQLNNTTSALVLFPLSAVLVVGLICLLTYLVRMLPLRRHPGPHPYDQGRYY